MSSDGKLLVVVVIGLSFWVKWLSQVQAQSALKDFAHGRVLFDGTPLDFLVQRGV
jgi:hypothetical protein